MLNARQRIAFWFVGLSALVYITPTILGAWFFYSGLTNALDSELKTLTSSLGHAIDLKGGQPHFRDWTRIVQTDPSRSLASIQLYDCDGALIERYGAEGIPVLIKGRQEATSGSKGVRVRVTPLNFSGRIVGYMQIEVSTKERDSAMRQFAWAMAVMAPAVLIGLGACSYYVSDKATVSIRQTVEMLRQFMADAGHELNTPLSIINASTEALQHKLSKMDVHVKETEVITSSAERMQKIIDGLSLLAEIETPVRAAETFAPLDFNEIIEQGLTEFSVKFEKKDVLLKHSEIPSCRLTGNTEALKMMVANLLENALRYTDAGGAVNVEAQRDGTQISLSITDTGIGIPSDSLPHIFERFYRVDKSRSRNSGGSGLGLAIAKAIAQAHKGDIDVESKLGAGSKFTVWLPVSPV